MFSKRYSTEKADYLTDFNRKKAKEVCRLIKNSKPRTAFVQVRCLGKRHNILLRGGRLTLLDHDAETDEGIKIAQILDPNLSCRCHEIMVWWKMACKDTMPSRWKSHETYPWMSNAKIKGWTPSGFLGMLPEKLRPAAREARAISEGRHVFYTSGPQSRRASQKDAWERRNAFAKWGEKRLRKILPREGRTGFTGTGSLSSETRIAFHGVNSPCILKGWYSWKKLQQTPWGRELERNKAAIKNLPEKSAWFVAGKPVDFPPTVQVLIADPNFLHGELDKIKTLWVAISKLGDKFEIHGLPTNHNQ